MTLAEYLKREQITQSGFAILSGVTQSRINAVCQGEGTSALTAFLIMRAAPDVSLVDLIGDRKRDAMMSSGLLRG